MHDIKNLKKLLQKCPLMKVTPKNIGLIISTLTKNMNRKHIQSIPTDWQAAKFLRIIVQL